MSISPKMLVFGLLAYICNVVCSETPIQARVAWLCRTLKGMDTRVTEALTVLPENGGEFVLKDMSDYNAGLKRLLQLLKDNRSELLEVKEAAEFLKSKTPAYCRVNIDGEKAKLRWGWLQEGIERINNLRSISSEIWSSINQLSCPPS